MNKSYRMLPGDITGVYERAWEEVQKGKSWPEISKTLLPTITTRYKCENLDLLPTTDPTIVLVNHPTHVDYCLAGQALERRTDMQIAARVPTPEQETQPARSKFVKEDSHFIDLLSTKRGGYVRENLHHLSQEVSHGVSVILVPWGCRDGELPKHCTVEQAMDNAMNLTRRSKGSVITAHIAIDAQEGQDLWPGPLPFAGVTVTLEQKISALNENEVRDAVRAMYERVTQQ
jgi:hypothetical protein